MSPLLLLFLLGGAPEVVDTSGTPLPALVLGGEKEAVTAVRGVLASRIDGLLEGENGQAQVSAACFMRDGAPAALIVLQPPGGSATLVERMAVTVSWPGKK